MVVSMTRRDWISPPRAGKYTSGPAAALPMCFLAQAVPPTQLPHLRSPISRSPSSSWRPIFSPARKQSDWTRLGHHIFATSTYSLGHSDSLISLPRGHHPVAASAVPLSVPAAAHTSAAAEFTPPPPPTSPPLPPPPPPPLCLPLPHRQHSSSSAASPAAAAAASTRSRAPYTCSSGAVCVCARVGASECMLVSVREGERGREREGGRREGGRDGGRRSVFLCLSLCARARERERGREMESRHERERES